MTFANNMLCQTWFAMFQHTHKKVMVSFEHPKGMVRAEYDTSICTT